MKSALSIAISLLLLTACSTLKSTVPIETERAQKPWQDFNGQLSILANTHRWQVLIHWQADLQSGKIRLTHAATGRIIELQWQDKDIQVRDNQAKPVMWRDIKADTLIKYGMVLSPQTIAMILHHQIPTSLKPKSENTWQGQWQGNTIRLRWQHAYHKLTMTDITHGRTAILRIFP